MSREASSITTTERLISACGGSLLTSLFVTPLDVVKVRLQAQASDTALSASKPGGRNPVILSLFRPSPSPGSVANCTHYEFSKPPLRFNGAIDAFVKIVKHEGPLRLWTGLPPTLVMAVPANVLYFTAYDELKASLQGSVPTVSIGENTWSSAPVIAGGASRIIAATAVSPIELVRTQMQANRGSGLRVIQTLLDDAKAGGRGVRSLWRGLIPTLFRDVPFSMVYWAAYELFQNGVFTSHLKPTNRLSNSVLLRDSFLSGLAAGSIAAATTTPFDVLKTRIQIFTYSKENNFARPSSVSILRSIVRTEGWSGLLTGLGPRVLRVAPSCAIMISSYEIGKSYFGYRRKAADPVSTGSDVPAY